ncbi:MAG: hypothetical protein WBN40_02600 [Pseudomonadales bacterium]
MRRILALVLAALLARHARLPDRYRIGARRIIAMVCAAAGVASLANGQEAASTVSPPAERHQLALLQTGDTGSRQPPIRTRFQQPEKKFDAGPAKRGSSQALSFAVAAAASPTSLTATALHARRILQRLWLPGRRDPRSMPDDIAQLADYIAARPAALALLDSLADKALRIRYSRGEFRTRISASAFEVHAATVYFDPRAAAVFDSVHCNQEPSSCTASPADAFLHELLHASSALLQSQRFLQSAVLESAIYPHAHEREIIARERTLFAAMSAADARPRPQREKHAGHLVSARCVTCVDS